MTEFLVCFGGFALVLLFVRAGIKAGGFIALAGMLGSLFALLVAMRYWFEASRAASGLEKSSLSLLAAVIFWMIFLLAAVIFKKLRENYTDVFEFVHPSIVDHALGAIFGTVTGAVYVTALMMTISLLAPQFWPGYKPAGLPLPVDRLPVRAYRFVEVHIAGVSKTDPGHTLLPELQDAGTKDPVKFWR
jgi:putative copper export protein